MTPTRSTARRTKGVAVDLSRQWEEAEADMEHCLQWLYAQPDRDLLNHMRDWMHTVTTARGWLIESRASVYGTHASIRWNAMDEFEAWAYRVVWPAERERQANEPVPHPHWDGICE